MSFEKRKAVLLPGRQRPESHSIQPLIRLVPQITHFRSPPSFLSLVITKRWRITRVPFCDELRHRTTEALIASAGAQSLQQFEFRPGGRQ